TYMSGDPQVKIDPLKLPRVKQQFERKKKELKDRSPENLLTLAEFALTHGLLPDFNPIMDELAKMNLSAAPTKVKDAVEAYKKVEADVTRSITKPDNGLDWRGILRYQGITYSKHYTLVHNSTNQAVEVQSRLGKLEQAYHTFYYWFALKGHALPVPDSRLVAILADNDNDFKQQHLMFDSVPLVADGFYARRDNLAVFAPRRMDEPYE